MSQSHAQQELTPGMVWLFAVATAVARDATSFEDRLHVAEIFDIDDFARVGSQARLIVNIPLGFRFVSRLVGEQRRADRQIPHAVVLLSGGCWFK